MQAHTAERDGPPDCLFLQQEDNGKLLVLNSIPPGFKNRLWQLGDRCWQN
jgi:hypothetical protein